MVALSVAIVVNAGVITHDILQPISDGTVLQGPSTKTHLVGPDGSQIIAEAPGGRVDVSGVVAHEKLIATVPDVVSVETLDVAPAVIAAKTVELDSVAVEASPVITSQIVAETAPIVAHTKTSISSHSIDQVHPSPAVVTHTAPIVAAVRSVPSAALVAAPLVKSATLVAHSNPIVAHSAHLLPHSASIVAHLAPVVAHSASVVAHSSPIVAHVSPFVAKSTFVSPVVSPLVSHSYVSHSAPIVTSHSAHLIAHESPLISAAVHAEHPTIVSW